MIHKLKIEPNYLTNLLSGVKKSEIRLNDRDYQFGDILEFSYWKDIDNYIQVQFKITHIHSGLGLTENYVVLSVELLENPNRGKS